MKFLILSLFEMKFNLILLTVILSFSNLQSQNVRLKKFEDGKHYYIYQNEVKNIVDTLFSIERNAEITDFLVLDEQNILIIEQSIIGNLYYHFIKKNEQWLIAYTFWLQNMSASTNYKNYKNYKFNFKIERLKLISFTQNGKRVLYDLNEEYKKEDFSKKSNESKFKKKNE
jgi:hypothetical protein